MATHQVADIVLLPTSRRHNCHFDQCHLVREQRHKVVAEVRDAECRIGTMSSSHRDFGLYVFVVLLN